MDTCMYKGASIEVMQDEFADNPRQWGLGTILSIDGANEVEEHLVRYVREDVNCGRSEKESLKAQFPDMVWFSKLYRYSHGADVWALHDNFPDRRWDVSHAGYVVVTRKDIREWYGRQRISQKLEDTIQDEVSRQLEEFTNWANGWVYEFRVEDSGVEDLDDIFYGGYNSTEEALDNAKAMLDDYLEKEEQYA